MENRNRELERKKRKRQRQLKRRLIAGGLVLGAVCLAAGTWFLASHEDAAGNVTVEGTGAPETGKNFKETGELETLFAENQEQSELENATVDETAETTKIESRETTVALAAKTELPSRYDLREQGTAPTVPDQGTFGTCWAFASLGALESSMPSEFRKSLSADHMSIRNSFGLGQDAGGDYSISSAYLLAWQGPVAAEDDPYGDGRSPEHLEPVCHVQEIQILEEKDFDAVKRAVYETGGVQSSFYMPQEAGAERDRYYNEETYAFYYDGSLGANHDVVIVGWEDDYPKENFVKEPSEDGAFLCMNTWGESFGDRGYFYISYEDSRIGTTNVSYTGIEGTDHYDMIHQTDLCGWTGQLGYGASKAWFANVYEAAEDEELAAAGFYATVADTSYRVYVAEFAGDAQRNADHEGQDNGGLEAAGKALSERKLVAEGHVANAGFYTVAWNEAVELSAGDRFAVVIEIDSPATTEPVAVEYKAGSRTANVDIEDGEGYISPDGINWQRVETEQQCNVCLKAYGRKKRG